MLQYQHAGAQRSSDVIEVNQQGQTLKNPLVFVSSHVALLVFASCDRPSGLPPQTVQFSPVLISGFMTANSVCGLPHLAA